MPIFGKAILRLFIDNSSGKAAEVLQVAYSYLVILSVTQIILYFLHIFRCTLQGLGNSFVPFLSGVMEFAARVSVAVYFSKIWAAQAIFFAEPLAWIAAVLVLAAVCIIKVVSLPKTDVPGRS